MRFRRKVKSTQMGDGWLRLTLRTPADGTVHLNGTVDELVMLLNAALDYVTSKGHYLDSLIERGEQWYADCSCGWRSELHAEIHDAQEAFAIHAECEEILIATKGQR
jgi:hypothetical protein